MNRWELLDSADIPDSRIELRLYQRGEEFSLRMPGLGELMTSRMHGSEDALADLTCAPLANRAATRVLVGGLGMGFTLAAALKHLAADAVAEVVELLPEVVRWNEGPLGLCAGQPLLDARAQVTIADVADVIANANGKYDAILLDVDNGPEGMTRRVNDRLYSLAGLGYAQQALKPNGTLAVWSAGPDRLFPSELRRAGFSVDERRVRAHGNKGSRHVIWLATMPSDTPRQEHDVPAQANPTTARVSNPVPARPAPRRKSAKGANRQRRRKGN